MVQKNMGEQEIYKELLVCSFWVECICVTNRKSQASKAGLLTAHT